MASSNLISKPVDIEGINFYFHKLNATDAFEYLIEIKDILLPLLDSAPEIIAQLRESSDSDERDAAAIKQAVMAKVFGAVLKQLTGKDARLWIDRLLTPDLVGYDDGSGVKKLTRDARERLDLDVLIQALIGMGEFNFKGPLSRWFGRLGSDQT